MPQFRWPEVQNDIVLAREVAAKRPTKMLDWEAIAKVLSTTFSTSSKPVHIKGRGCKERLERLLTKFSSDDRQALKRSGTEEDYSELTQLLQDISDYKRDVESAQEKEREARKLKEINDKLAGEEMRNSAMESMSQRKRRRERNKDLDEVAQDEFLLGDCEDEEPASPKKIKRASKLSAVEMLSSKIDRKADLKKAELEIRKQELELRKIQMEREHEEKKKAEEERKQRMELEFMERKAMIEIIQKLAAPNSK